MGTKRKLDIASISRGVMTSNRTVAAFRAQAVFHGLSTMQLSMLACAGQPRSLARYADLYRENAKASNFFILLSGAVQLSKAETGEATVLRCDASASHGVCFGVEAIANTAREDTVRVSDIP